MAFRARNRPAEHQAIPTDRVRVIAGALANGVAVLTVVTTDGSPRGTTVSAFTPVSFDPPLIMVAVNRDGRTHQVIQRCLGFGLSVLSADQQTVARHFASRRRPGGSEQFSHIPHRPGQASGAPLLTDTVAQFDCITRQLIPSGDHVLLIGEAITADASPNVPPLLHINHTYQRAAG
jgi:flavin reductase (DIM6/NTAB) family NADH-FMN oxidoreductase RutF